MFHAGGVRDRAARGAAGCAASGILHGGGFVVMTFTLAPGAACGCCGFGGGCGCVGAADGGDVTE